jgi:hypothetical protein
MAKRIPAIDSDPVLGRKRTADLLKQLRNARAELRRLKAHIAELESRDTDACVIRSFIDRRRAS